MPPGAPDPKLIMLKVNLTTSSRHSAPSAISPVDSSSTRAWPPPSTLRYVNPNTPASRKGIRSFTVPQGIFPYKSWVLDRVVL